MKRKISTNRHTVRALRPYAAFEAHLDEHLKSKKNVAAYLSSVLEDGTPELFLLALQDVAQAWGVSDIARRAKLGRESMYKTFKANPRIKTVDSILGALGLGLSVIVKPPKAA